MFPTAYNAGQSNFFDVKGHIILHDGAAVGPITNTPHNRFQIHILAFSKIDEMHLHLA